MSQSDSSIYCFKPMLDSKYYSYQWADKAGVGSAFVIGIKGEDGTWSIKYLKYTGGVFMGKGASPGTWQTMEYDDETNKEETSSESM